MNKQFVKNVNGELLYDGIKLELFVPSEFFKKKLAEETGQAICVFGSLRAYHYMSEDDDRSKAVKSTLCYPLKFYTVPDKITQEKIDFGDGEDKYTVLTYYNNGVLFTSSEIIQNADNFSMFMDLLIDGHLDIIEYSKIPKMIQLCKYYNGISLGTPATYEETMVAEYYRNPNNVVEPARFIANKRDSHFYAKGITQRIKASFTSTFTGITFEDINSMLTMADNAKRENRQETVSDVEKVSLGLI